MKKDFEELELFELLENRPIQERPSLESNPSGFALSFYLAKFTPADACEVITTAEEWVSDLLSGLPVSISEAIRVKFWDLAECTPLAYPRKLLEEIAVSFGSLLLGLGDSRASAAITVSRTGAHCIIGVSCRSAAIFAADKIAANHDTRSSANEQCAQLHTKGLVETRITGGSCEVTLTLPIVEEYI